MSSKTWKYTDSDFTEEEIIEALRVIGAIQIETEPEEEGQ